MWWVLRSLIITFAYKTPSRGSYRHAASAGACGNARNVPEAPEWRARAGISRFPLAGAGAGAGWVFWRRFPACGRGNSGNFPPDSLISGALASCVVCRPWGDLAGWFDESGGVRLLTQSAKSGAKGSSHVPSVHRWTHLGDGIYPIRQVLLSI